VTISFSDNILHHGVSTIKIMASEQL